MSLPPPPPAPPPVPERNVEAFKFRAVRQVDVQLVQLLLPPRWAGTMAVVVSNKRHNLRQTQLALMGGDGGKVLGLFFLGLRVSL